MAPAGGCVVFVNLHDGDGGRGRERRGKPAQGLEASGGGEEAEEFRYAEAGQG